MPLVVIILTLAGAVLRFATLDVQSFWLDEAVTVELVGLGLGDLLHRIPASESTPPLYYLLAWLWAKVFGNGEVALRSLSALLGTASIVVFYAAAAELCSRRVGIAAAALASFSPLLVWYSQEARTYALLFLLAALSLFFFARVLKRPSRRAAAGWGLFSALALASHYFAAFLVLPEAVWLAAQPAVRRRALPAVRGVVVATLALLPLALHQRSLGLASFIADEPLAFRLARTGKAFLVGFDAPLEVVLAVVGGAVVLVAAGVALARGDAENRAGARVAALLGTIAVSAPLLLALAGVDYFDTRNLLPAWLPLMTAVAAGLVSQVAGRAGHAALALLCVVGLACIAAVLAEPAWQRDDWRGMARALGPPDGPRVLAPQPASGARPLRLYLRGLERLPQQGALAAEIAILHPARRDTRGTHPSPPPPPRPLAPPDFRLVRAETAESYTLVVYRARQARVVIPNELQALRLVPDEPSTALLQR